MSSLSDIWSAAAQRSVFDRMRNSDPHGEHRNLTPEDLEWLVVSAELELVHERKLRAAGLVKPTPLGGRPGRLIQSKEKR